MTHTQFTPRYRNYVLLLLTITYCLNFVDRQLMTILLEPIKNEFGVSDTAMGFLTGFAFAMFYATLGVPVARLADNWSRRNVLAWSLAIWSGLTALCGAATSFSQMALLRIGVGVGEAGGTPPSHSLIADYFPPEKRSSAMSIHATGTQFGILIGMLGGALIADTFGWRTAFVVFGLPGVLLSLLIVKTVKEPIKKVVSTSTDSLLDTVKSIWAIPSFGLMAVATALTALSGYGLGAWGPSFLIRVHGLTLVEAGLLLGIAGTFSGLFGAIIGGFLCDRLSKKDTRWQLWLPSIGALVSVPLQGAFLLWPEQSYWLIGDLHVPIAIVFMLFGGMFASFWIGPTYAAVQNLAPTNKRTQASAMLLLMLNLIGMGLGPLFVGILSDVLIPQFDDYSLRYALVVSLAAVLAGSFLYAKAAGPYRRVMDSRVHGAT